MLLSCCVGTLEAEVTKPLSAEMTENAGLGLGIEDDTFKGIELMM